MVLHGVQELFLNLIKKMIKLFKNISVDSTLKNFINENIESIDNENKLSSILHSYNYGKPYIGLNKKYIFLFKRGSYFYFNSVIYYSITVNNKYGDINLKINYKYLMKILFLFLLIGSSFIILFSASNKVSLSDIKVTIGATLLFLLIYFILFQIYYLTNDYFYMRNKLNRYK